MAGENDRLFFSMLSAAIVSSHLSCRSLKASESIWVKMRKLKSIASSVNWLSTAAPREPPESGELVVS